MNVIWVSENIATVRPEWFSTTLPVFLRLLDDPDARYVRPEAPEIFRVIGKRRPDLGAATLPALTAKLDDACRVTPVKRTYPLMHEGIIPIPPPTNGEMFIAAHTGADPQVTTRAFGAVITPGLPYTLEPADPALSAEDLRVASVVEIVTYHPTRMTLVTAGRIERSTPPAEPLATFGDAIALRAAACHRRESQQISVELTWETLAPVEGQPTIFTHWLETNGALSAQADSAALRGLYPPTDWQPGEIIHELRMIEGADAPEGVVGVGLWSPEQNTRWPAHDAMGQPLPDQTYRLTPCSGTPEGERQP